MTLGIGEGETRSEGTKTKMRSTLYYRQYIQFNSRAPAVLAHTFCRRRLADLDFLVLLAQICEVIRQNFSRVCAECQNSKIWNF